MSSINQALRRTKGSQGAPVSYPGRYMEPSRSRNWMAWSLALLVVGLLAFSGGALAWKFRTAAPAATVVAPAPTAPPLMAPVQAEPEPMATTAGPTLSAVEDLVEPDPAEPGEEDDEPPVADETVIPDYGETVLARAKPAEPIPPKPQPTVLTEALPVRPELLPLPGEEPGRESGPLQARELFQRARAAQEDGRNEEAVSGYRQAILTDPGLTEAYLNLGNLLFYHTGDAGGAQDMYNQVLKLDPENKLAHNNLGVIRLQNGLLAEAEESFGAALKLDPDYVDAMYNMACLTARQGRADLTISYLQKVGRLNPDAVGWAARDHDFDGLRGSPEFDNFVAGNK